MTVHDLLSHISSQELSEWMAYYALEPWGCQIDDQRSGLVASVIANVNRDAKRRPAPYQVDDFMPKRGGEPREQKNWQQLLKTVELINAALGGEDKRGAR